MLAASNSAALGAELLKITFFFSISTSLKMPWKTLKKPPTCASFWRVALVYFELAAVISATPNFIFRLKNPVFERQKSLTPNVASRKFFGVNQPTFIPRTANAHENPNSWTTFFQILKLKIPYFAPNSTKAPKKKARKKEKKNHHSIIYCIIWARYGLFLIIFLNLGWVLMNFQEAPGVVERP